VKLKETLNLNCKIGFCLEPQKKPLDKEVLQKALRGEEVSRSTGPLCANCLELQRVEASSSAEIQKIFGS